MTGRRINCAGAWSCVWRAGIPRSLLSPPGEALWPADPMDHGGQRRERGGGQAAGPAARPKLAAPSAAAVPREIPTCSVPLFFRLSGPRAAACHGQFLRPASSMRSAPGRPEVMRRPGAVSPRLPAARRRNHYVGQAQPAHAAQPVAVSRSPALPRDADHTRVGQLCAVLTCVRWYRTRRRTPL